MICRFLKISRLTIDFLRFIRTCMLLIMGLNKSVGKKIVNTTFYPNQKGINKLKRKIGRQAFNLAIIFQISLNLIDQKLKKYPKITIFEFGGL